MFLFDRRKDRLRAKHVGCALVIPLAESTPLVRVLREIVRIRRLFANDGFQEIVLPLGVVVLGTLQLLQCDTQPRGIDRAHRTSLALVAPASAGNVVVALRPFV
jgi:hypothetical protein